MIDLDSSSDNVYWFSKTYQERLMGLEYLRQVMYGYDPTTSRLQRVFEIAQLHNVKYLLIAGYAVSFYGYVRATEDMDIWVKRTIENAVRLVTVLEEFVFAVPELSPDQQKSQWPTKGFA